MLFNLLSTKLLTDSVNSILAQSVIQTLRVCLLRKAPTVASQIVSIRIRVDSHGYSFSAGNFTRQGRYALASSQHLHTAQCACRYTQLQMW